MKPGNPGGFRSIDEETGDEQSDRKRRKMHQLLVDPNFGSTDSHCKWNMLIEKIILDHY
jgi:hypothetical protein